MRVELLDHALHLSRGSRSSSTSVQAAVPALVWWPANMVEIRMPVITLGE